MSLYYYVVKDSCLSGQVATTNSPNEYVTTDTKLEPSVR